MSFLNDFQKLRESVPHPPMLTINNENADYCPYNTNSKGCYLLVGHNSDEDCFYGYWVGFSKDCVDCSFIEYSTLCYECVDVKNSYNCNFSHDIRDCVDCDFCYDCVGCSDCMFCVNLRRKCYCIFNKQYTKDEYEKNVVKIKEMAESGAFGGSVNMENLITQYEKFKISQPHICVQGYNKEDCLGDHIYNSKNALYSFDVSGMEDCCYVCNSTQSKDIYDVNFCAWAELLYECHSGAKLYNSSFCDTCWYSQNLEYCEYVFNSHDCFGCVALNHAKYCILNKPYSEVDYFAKVAEIKAEMKRTGEYGKMFESQYEGYYSLM